MAKINSNMLVKGASGHVGKQFIYKQQGTNTVIAKMPRKTRAAVTNGQEQVRELFAAASAYASGAVNDPILKREYQKKAGMNTSAYNIAFRDYLKAPVVKSIDASQYNGSIGSLLSVFAKDDFRVAEVKVSITDINGNLVENGNAVLHPIDRNKWTYAATAFLADVAGSIITAEAMDIPGNKANLQITL